MNRLMSFNMDFLETSSVCRLCLKISSGGDIQMLEGFTMYMLKLVAPAVNLEISSEPKICNNCADKLKSTYDFKSVCLEYTGISQPAFLNKTKPQKEKVCKCCLCDNKDNLKKCKANEILFLNTMLEKCLPELDIEQISIICRECLKSVVNLFAFVNYCLDTEDKIKKYVQVKGLNKKGQVPILDIFHANIFVQEDNPGQVKVADTPEEVEDDPEPVYITDCEEGKSDSNVDSEAELKIEVSENTVKMEELDDCEKSAQDAIGKPGTSQSATSNFEAKIPINEGYPLENCKTELDCSPQNLRFRDVHVESNRNFDVHLTPHKEGNIYKCRDCNYSTTSRKHIKQHLIVHKSPSELVMFKCDICTFETKSKYNLTQHLLRHKDPHKDPQLVMYKCQYCEHVTKYKKGMRRHVKMVHRDSQDLKIYECDKCSFKSRYKGSYSYHLVTHSQGKPGVDYSIFKCTLCEYWTKRKVLLGRHMVKHNTQEQPKLVKCDQCEYETKYKSAMVKHKKRHRYKDYVINHIMKNRDLKAGKKFKCDKCPYETDIKYYLSQHNVMHMDKSEVEMHKCDKCDFETKYKKSIITHMLMHKDKSEVDMHKCEKCYFETKHKSSMTRHRLTHRDTDPK